MHEKIAFLGCPLIDIIASVDKEFLDKFGLKQDEITTSNKSNSAIFEEIVNYNPKIGLGGTITNTVRILHKLLENENVTVTYLGSIGKDAYGVRFKEELKREGIDHVLKEIEKVPTGKVAVLIADRSYRCMVTDLAASHTFEHGSDGDAFADVIQSSTSVYFSSLFLNVNRPLLHQLMASKKVIFFNLGAPFVIRNYREDVLKICSRATVVFGNESEYQTLVSLNNQQTDDLKQSLLAFVSTINWQLKTILVVTRGEKSVYVMDTDIKDLREYEFKSPDKIEDTDGSGDAFAGGFLAQYLTNKSIDLCVDCGLYAAQEVLQHVGFGFDADLKFRPEEHKIICHVHTS